mgnify:FL=1
MEQISYVTLSTEDFLGSRKGVNVPNVRVNLPSITEKR